jgi:hypothetical protein
MKNGVFFQMLNKSINYCDNPKEEGLEFWNSRTLGII